MWDYATELGEHLVVTLGYTTGEGFLHMELEQLLAVTHGPGIEAMMTEASLRTG